MAAAHAVCSSIASSTGERCKKRVVGLHGKCHIHQHHHRAPAQVCTNVTGIVQEHAPTILRVYVATEARRALVLRCHHTGRKMHQYEAILWETETDTFTRGQWLMRGKVSTHVAHISPDGVFFSFRHAIDDESIVHVVSDIPYFSARYAEAGSYGMDWNSKGVNPQDVVVAERESRMVPLLCESGQSFRLTAGAQTSAIQLDGALLYRDGYLMLDTSGDQFQNVAPPYAAAH